MASKVNIVLLIDDTDVVASRLLSMLKETEKPQVVLHAANYIQATQMMEEFEPDFVLIDIGFSQKKGMSLLEEIREQYDGTKIVVLTNLSNIGYRKFCESMGVNYFLDKSLDFELIPGIITSAELN